MATIFFSYSHKDEVLRNELETHLAMLRNEGLITSWHDRKLTAGDDFAGVIDAKLAEADLILLLVSSDFLASRYCYDVEMQQAMARHDRGDARVIPIILRPCDWSNAPFGKLLAAPTDGMPVTKWPDRDEAFLDIARQIRAALPQHRERSKPTAFAVSGARTVAVARSSNLRLKKNFTEADRDAFLDETFEFMARYFEASLAELEARNHGIKGRFKRIDAHTFTAVIYRHGATAAACSIHLEPGRKSGFGIVFSTDPVSRGKSFNEALSVEEGEQSLSLKAMGVSMRGSDATQRHLSHEGAAGYFWDLLIAPLQR